MIPNDDTVSHIHDLPVEVLLVIFVEVLDQQQSLRGITTLSLVCRNWNKLMRDDVVWNYVAKRHFVAFPLIRQLLDTTEAPPTRRGTPTPPSSPVLPQPPTSVVHRRPASHCSAAKPTMKAIVQSTMAVRDYLDQQQHAHRVAERRRYVLHVFVFFTLLFVFVSLVSFACAFEESFGCSRRTLSDAINFGWAALVLVVTTIVANIVMQTHFEPRPLLERIVQHRELIAKSTLVLLLGSVVAACPAAMLHYNYYLPEEDERRFTADTIVAPIAVAALSWQIQVFYRFRTSLAEFITGRHTLTPRLAYYALANATPTYAFLSSLAAAAYMQHGGGHIALVVGSFIPFIACIVLGSLFMFDYLTGAKAMDGVASLSLLVASGCPLLLITGCVRGLTLLPLAIAVGLFLVGHARRLSTLLHSVDELEVLVTTGTHSSE